MNERTEDRSSVDAFVEWAKARLDEMAAGVKEFESKIGELDAELRAEAEKTAGQVHQWIAEGKEKINEVETRGEATIADAQAYIEQTWDKFEAEANKWVEQAKNGQATFEARANAQVKAWQDVVDTYMKQAAATHVENRAAAEAQVEQLKAEAKKAEAQINANVAELNKAGTASWAVMSKALDDSRKIFAQAIETTSKNLNKAMKG
jgi:chromosome segregation ATPase